MRKIKILYTIPELMFSSKTRRLVQLVQGLDKRLFKVEISVIDLGDEATRFVKSLGVKLYSNQLNPPRKLDKTGWAKFMVSALKLKKSGYHIIHSLDYSSLYTEAVFAKLAGCRYVYTKSNPEWENHPVNWTIKSFLSDRIIVQNISGYLLLSKKGLSKKLVRIPNGVDTDSFKPASHTEKREARRKLKIGDSNFVFCYPAQFLECKDHITLIKAFRIVSEQYPKVTLLLCGTDYDDEYYERVLSTIQLENISEKVKILGSVSEMEKIYAASDCLVFPSKRENFSNVILEAMSSGLPVIAAQRGGNLEQVEHGENGFLVSAGDIRRFAKVMECYIKRPLLRSSHSQKSRELALQRFSFGKMVSSHQELYMDLVKSSVSTV